MYPSLGQFDGVMGPDGEGPGLKPSKAVSSDSSASPVTAAQNNSATDAIGTNRMSQPMPSSTTSSPKAPKGDGIDRTNWNRNVKVSQKMVDQVKSMGMKEAAKYSKMNSGADQLGVVGEMNEATNRVYPSAYTKPKTPATKADRAQTDKWASEDKAAADGKSGKSTATFGGSVYPPGSFGSSATPKPTTTPLPKKTDAKANATIGGKTPKPTTTPLPKKTDANANATIGGKTPKL